MGASEVEYLEIDVCIGRDPENLVRAGRHRRFSRGLATVTLVAATWAVACGGASSSGASGAASPASTSGSGSSAERCLLAAGAKHDRKPSEPDRISVRHVLVRYAGAKRAPETVTRTREQACLRAEEALGKLQQGTSFADVVREYSDESGADTREGSLGAIERNDVAPPFADAAFELHVNEVSAVVETPFGFHVILRFE
jgi:NIMA-interacting peptidyl-prolyl cis-trans isomerase 1